MPLALCCLPRSPLLNLPGPPRELLDDIRCAVAGARGFVAEFHPMGSEQQLPHLSKLVDLLRCSGLTDYVTSPTPSAHPRRLSPTLSGGSPSECHGVWPFRRIPTVQAAIPIEQVEFKHEHLAYGVYELPVTW